MSRARGVDTGFLVVIPARLGSVRLPGKVLLPLAGRPLIAWVHDRAVESGAERVVIATDDARVAEACAGFGAEVEMTAATHPSGSDRVAEVIDRLGIEDDAVVVNLQGDEPLIPPALLARVARDLAERPGHAIATLCTPIRDPVELFDPSAVKVVRDRDGDALYFSRAPIPWHREDFAAGRPGRIPAETGYHRHIGLYAYRAGYLRRFAATAPCAAERAESLEQLRALDAGERIHVACVEEAPPAGVDDEADLERVRALVEGGDHDRSMNR